MACETTNYSPVLLLLLLLADSLTATDTGSLKLYQVTDTQDGTVSWPVRGVATYEIGPQARQFSFHCVSTVNGGSQLSWSRLDGIPISQTLVLNGVSLDLNNPAISDSSRYRCQDSITNDRADLTLTRDNPAVQSVTQSQQADEGDNVTIEFYVSGLPAVTSADITWYHNGVELTTANFQQNKTVLVIQNTQSSDEGNYTLQASIQDVGMASVSTQLTISALIPSPSIATSSTTPSSMLSTDRTSASTPSPVNTLRQPHTLATITVTQCPISTPTVCSCVQQITTCTTSMMTSTHTVTHTVWVTPPNQSDTLPLSTLGTSVALVLMVLVTIVLLLAVSALAFVYLRTRRQVHSLRSASSKDLLGTYSLKSNQELLPSS